MRDRAHQICDTTHKEPELQHLQHVFQANGFLEDLVRKTLAHQPPSITPSGSTSEEPQKILCPLRQRIKWEAREGLQPTWGQGSIQAHEDTQTAPDETEGLHSRGEKEKCGLRGPLQRL